MVETDDGKRTRIHDVLEFKSAKAEKPRPAFLPTSAVSALDAHRRPQDGFRRQFGLDCRADLDLVFANL